MSEPKHATRRLLILSLTRSFLIAVALLFVYYRVPIHGITTAGTAIGLSITVVLFTISLTLEIRAILRADHPVSRAVETVATLLPLLLLLFAALYVAISAETPTAFSTPFNRTGALYFTITTFATVGYGDITPVTDLARIVAMTQMIIDLAVLGAVFRLVVHAAQPGRARRIGETGELPELPDLHLRD